MAYKKRSLKIPESPPLFADYLYAFKSVKPFFRWDPQQDLSVCFTERLHHYQFRKEISDILFAQNQPLNPSPNVLHCIEKLRDPKTIAVVTGQQVGLLSGPLYTIYKILTTLKLAEEFSRRYPSWHFVPLFWMEVGDSDYGEINHIHLIDQKNELQRLSLPDSADDHRSIYRREIPQAITDFFQQIPHLFPPNEFRNPILKKAADCYSPGKRFHTAFAEWIIHLLGANGIPLVNPADRALAKLAKPLFQASVQNCRSIQQIFSSANKKLLAKNYHTQIIMDENQTLLFYEADDGSRSRIDVSENHFVIQSPGKKLKISSNELFTLISEQAERFTPNVALRPLLQDWLLPTGVYVAGPAEISYAAQLTPLYENFQIVPPVFYPRVRLSLIESKIGKVVEKFHIDFSKLFQQRDQWLKQKMQQQTDQQFSHLFQESSDVIQNEMLKLQNNLLELDKTLEATVNKTTAHMLELLAKLRQKADEAYQRKMATDVNQLNKVLINLFPNGNYQERVLNVLQYLIKYGPAFITELSDSIDINDWNHQLIFL